MLQCKKCGAFLEEDTMFCIVCGTPVQKQETKNTIEKMQDEKSKRGWIPFAVIGGILIACICAFLGTFLLFGGSFDLGKGKDSGRKEKTKTEEREEGKKESQKDAKEDPEVTITITPTPEIRPENVSISFCETAPNLGGYYKLPVAAFGSTSYLIQEDVDHPNTADMVVDGNQISSWQEGVAGDGIGEAIWFDYPQEQKVKYLSFKLGNWRDLENWTGNNRPSRISIMIGNYQCAVSFPDEQREFWIELSEPYPARQIRFQIDGVHKGAKWDDTCIAEIGMYGE